LGNKSRGGMYSATLKNNIRQSCRNEQIGDRNCAIVFKQTNHSSLNCHSSKEHFTVIIHLKYLTFLQVPLVASWVPMDELGIFQS
jgi:hypothetical protein